jgi:tetratricopeptide (TPR) repeat protein
MNARRLGRVAIFGAFAVVLGLRATAVAGPREIEQEVRKAKDLIAAARYKDAADGIAAAQVRDPSLASAPRLHFLRGLALQQMAAAAGESGAKARALRQAESEYRKTLELDPRSGAALNNLAALLGASGRADEARELYQKAIDVGDNKMKGTYALNYARFLEPQSPEAALRMADLAVRSSPDSDKGRAYLTGLYSKYRRGEMVAYARSLVDQGKTESATSLALARLGEGGAANGGRRAWLILLVLALSRDRARLSHLGEDAVVGALPSLAEDPVTGPGAKEMLALLNAPEPRLDWWERQRDTIPGIGTSGRAAMLSLTRELGELSLLEKTDSGARAEIYLRAAIGLGADGPDPDAFLALIGYFAGKQDVGRIKELMDRNEFRLFGEKGGAYARGDWPLIYKLHLALGMTYAHLKIWRSGSPYQNAQFQLESANRAAERSNDAARRENRPPTAALPPVAIDKLSECYVALGQPKKAVEARIEGVERLRAAGRGADSEEVLKAIRAEDLLTLDPTYRTRYRTLREKRGPS